MAKPAAKLPMRQPADREIVEIPTSDLVENPRNPRVHSEVQLEHLMASLRADGQTRPVMARRANKMLIAGHGVHRAMLRLGMETTSVVLLDVDQARADRIMLGDNRQAELSTADDERVTELLREIDQADWMATGFSAEEGMKLLKGAEVTELKVYEIDTHDLEDVFWVSVRGPLADQAVALARLKTLMGEMPKVTVTLGTTDDLR